MTRQYWAICALGLSSILTGCGSVLYSGSNAPVYPNPSAKTGGQSYPPPLTDTTQVSGSIERPSGDNVAVINSQNDPYGNAAALPQRPDYVNQSSGGYSPNNTTQPFPAQQPQVTTNGQSFPANVNTSNQTTAVPATLPPPSSIPNAPTQAQVNAQTDPRIREASDVLGQSNQPANTSLPQQTAPVAVSRPSSVTAKPPANIPNATQAKNQASAQPARTTQPVSTPLPANTSAPTPTAPTAKAVPAAPQSATKALLQEARDNVAAGKYEQAALALERAHRIEPGNAKILYDIAQIRYAQGKYRQAESFASKAANYSKSNVLSKKIWRLLSNARKVLGNETGAAVAAKKAATF